jgi:hypothetical protein
MTVEPGCTKRSTARASAASQFGNCCPRSGPHLPLSAPPMSSNRHLPASLQRPTLAKLPDVQTLPTQRPLCVSVLPWARTALTIGTHVYTKPKYVRSLAKFISYGQMIFFAGALNSSACLRCSEIRIGTTFAGRKIKLGLWVCFLLLHNYV